MKTFKFLMPFLLVAFTFVGCNTDDLRNDIDELKNRVESLEALVSTMNDNVNALKVFAEGGVTISSYEQIGDKYKLVLSDGRTIELTQGQQGDVDVPTININENNEWVVNGNAIEGSVAKGDDAKAPQFNIQKDNDTGKAYWYVDYNDGKGYVQVKDLEGYPVEATTSGEVNIKPDFFEEVKVENGCMVVTLTTEPKGPYSLPIVEGLICKIETKDVDEYKDNILTVGYGRSVKLQVEVTGDTQILTAPAGWTAELGTLTDGKGELTITAPQAPVATSRAVADNTKDVVLQTNKGVNWAVAKIQVEAKKIINSYKALYDAGEIIELAGIKINKDSYPNAELIEGEVVLNADDKVYFVKPGEGNKLKYSSETSVSTGNIIIIGDDPSQKSSLVLDGQFIKLKQTSDDKSLFLCHNIEITANTANYSLINYGPIKKVVFDKCYFKLNKDKPFYSNSNKSDITRDIDELIISNSVLDFTGVTKNFFVADQMAYQFGITLKNNIFYSSSDYVMRLFSFKESNVDWVMQNNTFYKVSAGTNAFLYSKSLGKLTVDHNIFYSTTFTGNNLIARANSDNSRYDLSSVNCSFADNVGVKGTYKSGEEEKTSIWQVFYGGQKVEGCTEILSLEVGQSPFENVVEAELKFTPKAEYADYGAKLD